MTDRRWFTLLAFGLLTCLALGVRLYDLAGPTIGHIEVYVPGIKLPYEFSDPRPRFTVKEILTGTVAAEPHPPAYYLLMLPWTRYAGTGVVPLRLPSVWFGVGCVLLVYVLGRLEYDQTTALLAAGLLALHGQHIYWSQIAKLYVMGSFLGLLATVLLLLASRSGRWQGTALWAYVAATLAALATVVYSWAIFAAQVLWLLRGDWRARHSAPALLHAQLLVVTLASPLLALVAFQSRRPSYIEMDLWSGLLGFLQLGFLFEPDSLAVSPQHQSAALIAVLLLVTLLGLAAALTARRKHPVPLPSVAAGTAPPAVLLVLAAIFAGAAILGFAAIAHAQDPSRTVFILATALVPIMTVTLDRLLRRSWPRLTQWGAGWNATQPRLSGAHGNSLAVLLAIVPVTLLGVASVVVPLLTSSGTLLYVPYLLLVVAAGLVSLCRNQRRWVAAGGMALVAAVIGLHGVSALQSQERLRHPIDYKGLAERWRPRIESSDVILAWRHWATTPIFYYMDADQYRVVGPEDVGAAAEGAPARVWLLQVEGLQPPPEIVQAIAGYRVADSIEALRIEAILYVPAPAGPSASLPTRVASCKSQVASRKSASG